MLYDNRLVTCRLISNIIIAVIRPAALIQVQQYLIKSLTNDFRKKDYQYLINCCTFSFEAVEVSL